MAKVRVGEKVKVRYEDDRIYTLDVEVIATRPSDFIGRIEAIFLPSVGEITNGHAFNKLMNQEKTIENGDILKRR